LINGEERISGTVPLVVVLVLAALLGRVVELGLEFAEVVLVAIGVVVGADDASISRDDLAILNNDLGEVSLRCSERSGGRRDTIDGSIGEEGTHNITRNQFSGLDLLFLTVTHDNASHRDIALERRDDISSLLFLVPTDDGIEHQNTDDDTEINPVAKTGSEEDSQFHDCDGLITMPIELEGTMARRDTFLWGRRGEIISP
jgi:hypothetical protein